jgi:hypothetical protein
MIFKSCEQPARHVCHAQSRAGVYAEASAIVYTVGQSREVTAIAKIAGGLVVLRM